jgi:hypothetical protein
MGLFDSYAWHLVLKSGVVTGVFGVRKPLLSRLFHASLKRQRF